MNTEEKTYIIEGGEEGKKRLNVLSEILYDYTKSVIEEDGKITGKKFLDVGSGGGNVALMAAKMVGETGHVTAIDFDAEIVRLAEAEAKSQNVLNIQYAVTDAYKIDYNGEFDIAYSRFLLSHLEKPEMVLNNMLKSLKPGGRIIVEDIDFSGHFCYPPCSAFDAYIEYYITAAKNTGQNPTMGLSLFQLFKTAGINNIRVDVVQPFYNEGIGKWMAYFTMDKIKNTVIRQGLATAGIIEKVLSELKEFTENPDTVMSLPRIFRVRG